MKWRDLCFVGALIIVSIFHYGYTICDPGYWIYTLGGWFVWLLGVLYGASDK